MTGVDAARNFVFESETLKRATVRFTVLPLVSVTRT